jgi:protein phosphatase
MLCSDGLSRMVSHDALVETLMNQELSLEDRAHRLVEQANQAGGRDNVTVILVQIAGGKCP